MIVTCEAKEEKLGIRVRAHWVELASAAFIAVWFLYFAWNRVTAPFAADDMMNLATYFRPGAWHALTSQILIWQNHFRPMGAAFYLPLFVLFGLNAAPYHVAIMGLMGANSYFLYRFARNLGCNRMVAGVAALLGCYHSGLVNIHYNIDMVYDVLCFFFYFAAFNYYVRIRRRDRSPAALELVWFFALYLCALNSKEMAVTLPVLLLAYEWLYQRPAKLDWTAAKRWATGPGRIVGSSVVLNLVYIYGKAFGPDPLMKNSAYSPVFSIQRILDFQKGSITDLLCLPFVPDLFGVAVVWSLLTCLAWMGNRPALRFCWVFMIVTPLPIEFLVERYQGALYIPMAAWVVFGALVIVRATAALSTNLAAGRAFRFTSRKRIELSLMAAAVLLLFIATSYRKAAYIIPAAKAQGHLTGEVIGQLQALKPHVRPHGKLVFLNDPFVDWDMAFIAELVLRDRNLEIYLQRLDPLPASEMPTADAIFDWRKGKLIQIK